VKFEVGFVIVFTTNIMSNQKWHFFMDDGFILFFKSGVSNILSGTLVLSTEDDAVEFKRVKQ
jgi:hypothetical protein